MSQQQTQQLLTPLTSRHTDGGKKHQSSLYFTNIYVNLWGWEMYRIRFKSA